MRKHCKSLELNLAHLVASIVAIEFGVAPRQIFALTKGSADCSFARQTSMYLTHVIFKVKIAGVARAFQRDPSTVSHACQLIEDWRDDHIFDETLCELETILRSTLSLSALQAPIVRY